MRLFIVLLLCVSARADDGFQWAISDTPAFEWRVTERGDPNPVSTTPGSGGERPASLPAPELSIPRTTVCQCQGYREHLCHCLKAGQKCHCTRTSGSVWAVNEQGRATHKTGAKADPRKASPLTTPAPTVHRVDSSAGYEVQVRDGIPYWTAGGVEWHTDADLVENRTYANRFQYRSGRMHEWKPDTSVMAADIAPRGHYEIRRVCRGSYCENVRVWVPE